ncbi:MAG TPA: hypothetical protein VMT62_05230 [Syntrophorhabdaceae bacterium]|nr:hypothetical protein [Syntrophorhabdaceae bacterium]
MRLKSLSDNLKKVNPWLIPSTLFILLVSIPALYKLDIVVQWLYILVTAAAFATLFLAVIYIYKYWKETRTLIAASSNTEQRSDDTFTYSIMPVMGFTPKNTEGFEALYVKNKGKGPALNVSVLKMPLPDSAHLVTGVGSAFGHNAQISERYSIVGPDEELLFFREDDYAAKRIQIQITFHDMFKRRFIWVFEGKQRELALKEWNVG